MVTSNQGDLSNYAQGFYVDQEDFMLKASDKPVKRDKNNPLGQRIPSERVGGDMPNLEHNQSAELVEQVRQRADRLQGTGRGKKHSATADYDITGPDRQPGKRVRQNALGKQPRRRQLGQYTQDNEEENTRV